MKIAITGGIGSGKSLVSKYLSDKGYPVFSCDKIYKEICDNREYLKKLSELFGNEAIKNGKINRKYLSDLVFHDKESLKKLNGLSHPMIMSELMRKMDGEEGVVFAEVPLLFEGNYENLFDKIIIVYRPLQKRILSIMERDGIAEEEALSRINHQVDYEEKIKQNDFIIYNDGDIAALKRNIEKILHEI